MTAELRSACEEAHFALVGYVNEFFEEFAYMAGSEEQCRIVLAKNAGTEEVAIRLAGIRFLSITNSAALSDGSSIVDEISISYLPSTGKNWPTGAEHMIRQFSELPSLVWLRITGLVELNVISSMLNISR
ncbi:hypothetical protein [Actinomadura livida]|uniref:Uncharacterized protein n=1 Tax=Actinomadura livida TaxID=79909 RepID=A0A7W7ICR3_9ACTN|nr:MULTISPECIES: hypothetical protein [Actinomadura]MBB4774707.1 hypothetical protein [Actinomadura catellatispora]GGU06501.1 hypothetical protein GCM10010208_33670 [Actinomadura livida]